MSKPIVFITGANTGLGLETVKALISSGKDYEIVAAGRSLEKIEAAVQQLQKEFPDTGSVLSPVQLDIEDDASITKAVEEFQSTHDRLDVLINNAGASFDRVTDFKDPSSMRSNGLRVWNVNVVGTNILTWQLVPLLLKAATPRILFITSGRSSFEYSIRMDSQFLKRINTPPEKGWPKASNPISVGYRCSKAGVNMLMRDYEQMLRNDGVKVFSVSPGLLATNLGGTGPEVLKKMGAKDPAEGAAVVREVVEGGRDADAGLVIGDFEGEKVQPW